MSGIDGSSSSSSSSSSIICINEEWNLKNINELFIESYRQFYQLVLYESDNNDEKILFASKILELTIKKVDNASLFSKNEDYNDYSNESLKYLFLSYFQGKIYSKYMNIKNRKKYLQFAKQSLQDYIEICKKCDIVHEDDKIFIDNNNNHNDNNNNQINENMKRTLKITKFKREKEAKESMKALLLKMNIESKKVPDYESIDILDDDEDTKKLLLLQFQSYIRDAIDEIVLIDQEIDLLEHMSELKELEDEFGSNKEKILFNQDSRTAIANENISYLPSINYSDQREHNGLSITRMNKVDDQLIIERETIKANVFTPSMAPPTISLEEFADMEREKAIERSANESNESNITRRYNQLVADGDEDDAKLVDLATIEDRNWDDFREENPRGWGNKMGKRF